MNQKKVLYLPSWFEKKRKKNIMEAVQINENLNLRGQKSTGILIGYVLTLALMFCAFEYTQRDPEKVIEEEKIYEMAFEEDMIPITQQQEVMAPPPAAAPKVAEIINIVDNETELPDEEVETSAEVNQAITTVVGTGSPSAVASGPVGPIVEAVDDDRIFDVVEENAQFPGGDEACMKWLRDHIKYPSICQEQGVQGRVIVSFVVNRDGSIVDAKVMRSPDQHLSDEALRVVNAMPKWKPARQGNKTVRSRFNLPVMFRLG